MGDHAGRSEEAGRRGLSHSNRESRGSFVIRRYEFYKYTGAYSKEHEVACGGDGTALPLFLRARDYIGAQMAAAIIGAATTSVDLARTRAEPARRPL